MRSLLLPYVYINTARPILSATIPTPKTPTFMLKKYERKSIAVMNKAQETERITLQFRILNLSNQKLQHTENINMQFEV
jgi:hypothetical protein